MNIKKIVLLLILLLFVSVFGFSQVFGNGLMVTYNPLNPSLWSVGYMGNFTADYSGKTAHFFRIGTTVGQTTVSYKINNPFTYNDSTLEFWQKGAYYDFILGYSFQVDLIHILALHFGVDAYTAISYAYISDSSTFVNAGVTGVVGLMLFPKGKYFVSIDACPGYTLNPLQTGIDVFSFIVPIRLTVGMNIGLDVD